MTNYIEIGMILTDWEIRTVEEYRHTNPAESYNFMRDKLNELETRWYRN